MTPDSLRQVEFNRKWELSTNFPHSHTHTCSHTHTHTQIHTHTHARTNTHTQIHTHTRTYTRTHARTYTHLNCFSICFNCPFLRAWGYAPLPSGPRPFCFVFRNYLLNFTFETVPQTVCRMWKRRLMSGLFLFAWDYSCLPCLLLQTDLGVNIQLPTGGWWGDWVHSMGFVRRLGTHNWG